MKLPARSLFIALAFLCSTDLIQAQPQKIADSLKREVTRTQVLEDKLDMLDVLSRTLMSIDREEAEAYGKELTSAGPALRKKFLRQKETLKEDN